MKQQLSLVILAVLIAFCNGRELNKKSIDLIKGFEGWRPCAYYDPVGKLTIGYGHLVKPGDRYKIGTCINLAEGETLLRKDVRIASSCIDSLVRVGLTDNQYGALSSWVYNVGCGNARSSTLIKVLNQNHKNQVCNELKKWNKSSGKVLPGLVRRRQAECDLFNSA